MNAPDYKLFYANAFKLRISPADIAITFGVTVEDPNDPAQQAVRDEATVMLALPQLAAVAKQLHDVVLALDEKLGAFGGNIAINWSEGENSGRAMVENLAANLQRAQPPT